jgi:hypothetical protein
MEHNAHFNTLLIIDNSGLRYWLTMIKLDNMKPMGRCWLLRRYHN